MIFIRMDFVGINLLNAVALK